MATANDGLAAAHLREKVDNLGPNEAKFLKDAPLVPEWVAELLSEHERQWDHRYKYDEDEQSDDPYYIWETERYKNTVRKWASREIRKAIRNGNLDYLSYCLGVVEEMKDVSQIDKYETVSSWVTRTAGVTYLAGHMGVGKTDFALLYGQIFKKRLKNSSQNVHIAGNIKSCTEVDYIGNQPDLAEWLEEKDGYKLFIFDEASSHAHGFGGNSQKVYEQLGSMIKLIRKSQGNIVIIGHSGKDLAKDIRRLADYVDKTEKKAAVVYEEVVNGQGKNPKFSLDKIPPTNWDYDTHEKSSWKWAVESEDTDDIREKAAETYARMKQKADGRPQLTQSEIAEIHGVNSSQISERYGKYMDGASA